MKKLILLIIGTILLLMIGCSGNENEPLSPEPGGATILVTVNASEIYYINLSQETEVDINDPLIESDWDFSIENLTNIKLNGGSTAPGAVYAKLIDGVEYADFSTAPNATYKTDTQNGNYIGENWYYYDISTHTVNPLDTYYVIKATDGNFYKFMISDAVFTSRTEGELTFKVQKINAPSSYDYESTISRVMTHKFPISSAGDSYFNLKQANTVDISDESTSMEWDFRSSYVTIQMNNGTSGPGSSGVIMYEDTEFDSVKAAPNDGYFIDDSTTTQYGIGDSWYTYDFTTHTLTVNQNVYVIDFNNGNYAKLAFLEKDFSGQTGGYAVIKFQYIEGTKDF